MRRAALAALLVIALALAVPAGPARGAASTAAIPQVTASLVKAASWPTAFQFAADGRIFYARRFDGQIRIYNPNTGSDTRFYRLSGLVTDGERGLLGLALHPNYPTKPFVYAYYTHDTGSGIKNEIVKLKDVSGKGQNLTVLLSRPSVSGYHNGGVIGFGPDNKLYAVVGDGHSSANAQNLSNDLGKVLRIGGSGGVPSDNPFTGSRIWSFGLRNSYGFTWDPDTGSMWETENGPECNDEINLIVKGGNYAWGSHETCAGTAPGNTNQDGPTPRILPEFYWANTIAPTNAAFCDGCGLTGQQGHLITGDCNNGDLHTFTLDAARDDVAAESILLNRSDCILDIEPGTNGTLYFSDPNGIYRLGN